MREQTIRGASRGRTVCEVIREVNDIHQGDTQIDLDTRELLREALDMVKRMDRKLKEYSKEYDAGWWEQNPDYERDLERRLSTDYVAQDDAEIPPVVRKIPSMGGREIGRYLRKFAGEMGDGFDAVELGVWLGAGTAQMALGIHAAGTDSKVYAFDKFHANASQLAKARDQGVILGDINTLPLVRTVLGKAGVNRYVKLVQGSIPPAAYWGRRIGLHVDDACKQPRYFLGALQRFGPHWVPGKTIVVLMDFWYFERNPKKVTLRFQHDWMNKHRDSFECLMDRLPGVSASVFRFTGGEPWRE